MTNRKHRSDLAILFSTLGLMALGLIVIYAIGPMRANVLNNAYGTDYDSNYFFLGQLRSVGLALIAFFVAFKWVPAKSIQKIAKPLMIISLLLSALLWILSMTGSSIAKCELGECRWFNFGSVSFQPAELLKLSLVIYLADFFSRKKDVVGDLKEFWLPLIVVCGVSLFLVVVAQGDLGTGIALIAIILGMLLASGVPISQYLLVLVIIVVGAVGAVAFSGHRMERVDAWVATLTGGESSDSTYHIENAMLAIGVGGFGGVGIGNSVQATGYLPESINDSVFAIMGETFGFVGLFIIIAIFGAMLLRMLKVADHTSDSENRLLVIGVFSWTLAQVAVNIMAMTSLAPVTGITLPLLSYGGTSMIFIAFALGLVLQISCYTSREVIKNEDTNSGRGSGGHITPAVAVTREIITRKPRAEVEFWTDPKYYNNVTKLTTELGVEWGDKAVRRRKSAFIRVRRIPSGKFHRYANWHFKDFFIYFNVTLKELIFGNIIGFFGFIAGLITSFFRLLKKRPDVIFLKGGYVCLPVGLVARIFKIPYIIHESDTVAGLANRILMKKARKVAFGMPLSKETLQNHPNYIWTGIPVGAGFKAVTPTKQLSLKRAFSFNPDKPLVVITGGSQGSESLNEATRAILPELLKMTSVGLVAGRSHYEDMIDLKKYENWDKATLESNFRMWEFNTTMDELMGAADVVVSRAGATTIAEMAALKKATILIPFERLPGGHQTKNAERLSELEAAVVLSNDEVVTNPNKLLDEIRHLVKSPRTRADMADRLHREARADAASRLAEIVLEEATKGRHEKIAK